MIIATAGHIDHGKTSLVRALTGVQTDRLPEEQRRGLSIELGFAYAALRGNDVLGIVDVPGHERFVSKMIAGISAVDHVLLVVAADDGLMPQTHEHVAIIDLLGIGDCAVVITKIDRASADRVSQLCEQVRGLLRDTSIENAPVFAVSTSTGSGVSALKAHLAALGAGHSRVQHHGNFRMAVDRVFSLRGVGMVVTGTVFSGAVAVGARVMVSPAGLDVRVRSLHAQNRRADWAGKGQRAALNLSAVGLQLNDVRRGDWVVAVPAHYPTTRIDTRIRVLSTETKPLRHLTPVHVHHGASDIPARIVLLEQQEVAPGGSAFAQIVLSRPTIAAHGDRFVVRDQSAQRTVGGGRVLDPFAMPRLRRSHGRLELLRALELRSPESILNAALVVNQTGLDFGWFGRALNLTESEALQLCDAGGVVCIGESPACFAIEPVRWRQLLAGALGTIKDWHSENPEGLGASEHEIARRLPSNLPSFVLKKALETLVADDVVRYSGGVFSLPGRKSRLAPSDLLLWNRMVPLLSAGRKRPPTVLQIADALRSDPKDVQLCLKRAAALGLVQRVAPTRFFLTEVIFELAQVAVGLADRHRDGSFDTKSYKDAAGIGRQGAVEILEFFDRAGLTRRIGPGRKVMRPATDVFEGRESLPGGAPGLQNR